VILAAFLIFRAVRRMAGGGEILNMLICEVSRPDRILRKTDAIAVGSMPTVEDLAEAMRTFPRYKV
jgi:hypothetical protein